jgi:hypothetical protein
MIILTAFAIGLLSTAMRSLACYVLIALMIVASFIGAALISVGAVSLTMLMLALLGYNAGIGAAVATALAVTVRRRA